MIDARSLLANRRRDPLEVNHDEVIDARSLLANRGRNPNEVDDDE